MFKQKIQIPFMLIAQVFMVLLAIGFFFSIQNAHAAAGEGTATVSIGTGGTGADDATYGGAASTGEVTVGEVSYLDIALTIGASHIAAAEDNITVQIPLNLFPATTFALDETGTADVDAAGEWNVTFVDNGGTDNTAINITTNTDAINTGLITFQADEQMDAGDVIHFWVAVEDITNAIAATNIVIQTDDTGANDRTTLTAGVPTVSTAAETEASATVELGANDTVGDAGVTTITLTSPFALDADDTIEMTFPGFINLSPLTGGQVATGTFNNSDAVTITCTSVAQLLTCVLSDVGASLATGTIILTDIESTYAGTTNMTSLEIENEGIAADDIVVDTSVTLTDVIPNADASGSIVLATPTVGGVGATTITITPPNAIDVNDTIDITFPDYINVSAVSGQVATGTLDNSDAATITCTATLQVVTCTVTVAATLGTEGTIILTGITSYGAGTADITTFEIEKAGVAADDMLVDTSVTLTNVTATDAAATLTLANGLVGSIQNTTLALTLPLALATSDTIVFTAPTNLNVTSTAFSSDTFAGAGAFTCTATAQVITCVATGAITAGAGTIIMSGISPSRSEVSQVITSLAVNDVSLSDIDMATDASGAVTPNTFSGGSSGSSAGSITVVTPAAAPDYNASYSSSSQSITAAVSSKGSLYKPLSFATALVTTSTDGLTKSVPFTSTDAKIALMPSDKAEIALTFTGANTITGPKAWDNVLYPPITVATSSVIKSSVSNLVATDVLTMVSVGSSSPLTLSSSAVLTVPVSLADGVEAQVWSSDDGIKWTSMGNIKASGGLISIPTTHLSYFAVGKTLASTTTTAATPATTTTTTPVTTPATTTATTAPASFTDVTSSHANTTAINYLLSNKVVKGYADGTFKPSNTLNRAEFTKIVVEAKLGKAPADATTNCFSDVKSTEWYASYVCYAKAEGIIGGYADGTFKPGNTINLAEATKILVNTLGVTKVTPKGKAWYSVYVESMSANGYLPTSLKTFAQNVNRGEMAEMTWRVMEKKTTESAVDYKSLK